jgi:hypothetical protein
VAEVRLVVVRPRQVAPPARLHAEALYFRATAALAAAAASSDRTAALRDATGAAARIERLRGNWTTPLARLVRAGIAELRGDVKTSVSLIDRAGGELEALDMAGFAGAARAWRGRLRGVRDAAESTADRIVLDALLVPLAAPREAGAAGTRAR